MSHFFIQGEGGKPHQILLMDVIGDSWWEDSITAKEIVHALATVDDNDSVLVRINCRGGETDDGTVIYNALADRPGDVECRVEGYASSMATVVMCAGDTTRAYETALAMVHKSSTIAAGNADDFRAAAEMLDKVDEALSVAYSRKMGVTQAEAKEHLMGDRDKWKTAAELEEMGLIDEVITPQKFAVLLDKGAVAVLGNGEGAALIDPEKAPSALLPHIEGVKGVMAVRVGPNSIDVTKAKAALSGEADPPEGGADDGPDSNDQGEDNQGSEGDDAAAADQTDPPPADDPPPQPEPAPEPETPEQIAAKAQEGEKARIRAIMAMAKKNNVPSDGQLVQGLIVSGATEKDAGAQIMAVAQAISEGLGAAPPQPQQQPEANSGWGAAYKAQGVKIK